MKKDRTLEGRLGDYQIAALLSAFCIVLYSVIFAVLATVAASHGASPETMIGLNLGPHADTGEYINLAHTMVQDGRFALSSTSPTEFARVPGYPTFLIIVEAIFHTLLAVPAIQIVFTAATVALIYLIGVRYFSRSVALVAALLYLFDPIVIYAAWIPISESLFMLLFMGCIYASGLKIRKQWLAFVLAGVLFALSVYVRPIGFYLAPIVACLAFDLPINWKESLQNAGIFLVTAFLVMSPWMLRNYNEAGYFEFSSNRAWQMYAYNMALFEQARTGISYEEIQRINAEPFGTSDEHILRQFAYAEKLDAITKQKILAHPFEYAVFHLYKSAALFISSSIVNVTYHMHQFGILTGAPYHGEGAWGMIVQHRYKDAVVQTFTHIDTLLERIFLALMYLGAFAITIYALVRRKPHAIWMGVMFVLINAYAFMIGPGSDDTRYRMPIESFIFMLGTSAAFLLYRIIRARFNR
jgi:4-amino-4-deoxy-L-arabinose transferase-like glycosyltransferase